MLVSIGADLTTVAVRDGGVPKFIRSLAVGGSKLTETISNSMHLEFALAERLKRGTGSPATPQVTQARKAMSVGMRDLAEDVRATVDFFTSQGNGASVDRILVTGGASMTEGLAASIGGQLPVPVTQIDPFSTLSIGDVGAESEQLKQASQPGRLQLWAWLLWPVGSPLIRLSILPDEVAAARRARRAVSLAAGGVAAIAVVLGVAGAGQILAVRSAQDQVRTGARSGHHPDQSGHSTPGRDGGSRTDAGTCSPRRTSASGRYRLGAPFGPALGRHAPDSSADRLRGRAQPRRRVDGVGGYCDSWRRDSDLQRARTGRSGRSLGLVARFAKRPGPRGDMGASHHRDSQWRSGDIQLHIRHNQRCPEQSSQGGQFVNTTYRRIGVVAGVAVLVPLWLPWYLLLFSPEVKKQSAAHKAHAAAEAQISQLRSQVAQFEALVHEVPADTKTLSALKSAIPDDPDLTGALALLQGAETQSGVTLTAVGPAQPGTSGQRSRTGFWYSIDRFDNCERELPAGHELSQALVLNSSQRSSSTTSGHHR